MTNRNFFSYLFIISLIATTISCSSGDKSAPADESAGDVAQAASESVESAPPATDEFASQDPAASSEQPTVPADEAVQTEAAQDMNAVDPNQPPTDTALAEPVPESSPAPEQAPTDVAQNETPAPESTEAAPPADQNAQSDLFGGAAATTDAAPVEDAPKKSLSLTHIKDKPFKKGGQLLNTVYIAREGDTLEGISDKLFGENKTKELKKANPHLKKGVTTGAKVYFNSPNRPDDAEKMMTVYEDQGLPPTTYATNEGDTLKSLAMEWYGTEASYKEIYAINRNLASTKELPAGTELQYWPASVSIVAYSTKKAEEPAQVAEAAPPVEAPAPAQAEPIAPPPAPIAQNSPAPDAMAAGSVNNTLPPPPPDLNAPALPPPPTAISKKKSADAMDKDTVMYAVAAGVLLVGGGALVAIRRKNAKRNSGVTQI